jgi:hypothetical protein
MKRFLRWKYRSIPMGIVSAVLILCLLAGSAFAGYGFFNGSAEVTVVEPMTVVHNGIGENCYEGFSWDPETGILTLNISPSTCCDVGFYVTNNIGGDNPTGQGILTITPIVSNPYTAVTASWNPAGPVDLNPEGDSQQFDLTICADGGAPPGSYTFSIGFERS